ncbi:MAG: hypothetical protein ACYTG5_14550 [Planctomycetota bacterium]|jgi:hypothetical protein
MTALSLRILAASLLLPALLGAQDPRTAADVTGVGRGLDRPLDIFLGVSRSGLVEERQLFILVDADEELAQSGFLVSLERALQQNRADLTSTSIGVAQVAANPPVILEPTLDHSQLIPALRKALSKPRDEVLNVYADVRSLAKELAGRAETRQILLVTLLNGDAEDDLQETTRLLERAKVSLSVITSEAYLSDNYWAKRSYLQPPKDCKFYGPDSAYIDLPWTWLFQREPINEVTPSGYAFYGLSRLAAASGGRVHIYTPASKGSHSCGIYNSCILCSGDHISPGELYKNSALESLAPMVLARKEVGSALAADPYYRATNRLWQAATRAGLLSGTPPLKLRRTTAQPQASRGSFSLGLTGLSFSSQAKTADKAVTETQKLIKNFERELKRIPAHVGIPRQRAIAELSQIMLRLTQINLISYSAFCRGIGPELADPESAEPLAPEVPSSNRHLRARGIIADGIPLCHGLEPFFELELPGREAILPALEELEPLVSAFEERYRNTPYLVAMHRAGMARFYFHYAGTSSRVRRQRPGSNTAGTGPLTGNARPSRRTTGSSTGSSGPTTGRRR